MPQMRLGSSVPLTLDELRPLEMLALSPVTDDTEPDLKLPVVAGGAGASTAASPGSAYAFGIDPTTVLVLAFAQLPAAFLASLAGQSAQDFWRFIKGLLRRVGYRRKAIPLSSVQVQLSTVHRSGTPIQLVITALHADYVRDGDWTAHMASVVESLQTTMDAAVPAQYAGKPVTVHVLLNGTNAAQIQVSSGSP